MAAPSKTQARRYTQWQRPAKLARRYTQWQRPAKLKIDVTHNGSAQQN